MTWLRRGAPTAAGHGCCARPPRPIGSADRVTAAAVWRPVTAAAASSGFAPETTDSDRSASAADARTQRHGGPVSAAGRSGHTAAASTGSGLAPAVICARTSVARSAAPDARSTCTRPAARSARSAGRRRGSHAAIVGWTPHRLTTVNRRAVSVAVSPSPDGALAAPRRPSCAQPMAPHAASTATNDPPGGVAAAGGPRSSLAAPPTATLSCARRAGRARPSSATRAGGCDPAVENATDGGCASPAAVCRRPPVRGAGMSADPSCVDPTGQSVRTATAS